MIPRSFSSLRREARTKERKKEKREEGRGNKSQTKAATTNEPTRTNQVQTQSFRSMSQFDICPIEFKKLFQIFIFICQKTKEKKKNRTAIDSKQQRRLARLDYARKQTPSRVTYIRISKRLDSIERGLRNERLMDTWRCSARHGACLACNPCILAAVHAAHGNT